MVNGKTLSQKKRDDSLFEKDQGLKFSDSFVKEEKLAAAQNGALYIYMQGPLYATYDSIVVCSPPSKRRSLVG